MTETTRASGWRPGLFRAAPPRPSPFAEADDKIALPATALASGSAATIRASPASRATRWPTVKRGHDLPTNKIRALAVDSAGDLWAATDAGVVRYKNDREVWVPMAEAAGLDGLVDVVGVAVQETADSRFVVIGAASGTAILGL